MGAGIGAAVSLGALLGTDGNHVLPGVIAGHAALITVGFFLAAWCHWFDKRVRGAKSSAKDAVIAELQELDERAPTTVEDRD